MTRDQIEARAAERRGGKHVAIDRDEGHEMVEAFLVGTPVDAIAMLHGVPHRQAQRRLYSAGAYSTPLARDPRRPPVL